MKKTLLLFLLFLGFSQTQISAQTCDPNVSLVDSVSGLNYLFPPPYDSTSMTGGFEDTACIGVYYETVLNFVIPEEVEISPGTFIALVNIQINGVTGLPAGISYTCNPDGCIFKPADTVACVLIYGTATANNTPGDKLLGITGTAQTAFGPVSLDILIAAAGGGAYYLHLRDAASSDYCLHVGTKDVFADVIKVSANPNPFSYFTTIEVASHINADFEFQVVDMLGALVHSEKVAIKNGINQIKFDGSELPGGMYFYTFNNPRGQLSGKMLINR